MSCCGKGSCLLKGEERVRPAPSPPVDDTFNSELTQTLLGGPVLFREDVDDATVSRTGINYPSVDRVFNSFSSILLDAYACPEGDTTRAIKIASIKSGSAVITPSRITLNLINGLSQSILGRTSALSLNFTYATPKSSIALVQRLPYPLGGGTVEYSHRPQFFELPQGEQHTYGLLFERNPFMKNSMLLLKPTGASRAVYLGPSALRSSSNDGSR